MGGASGHNSTVNATPATMNGGGANAMGDNATTMVGGDLSTSQIRDYIEQACIALEVGDTEGALMQLNFVIGELGSGSDSGGTQGNNTNIQRGADGMLDNGVSVGGTSATDDYDATADAETG